MMNREKVWMARSDTRKELGEGGMILTRNCIRYNLSIISAVVVVCRPGPVALLEALLRRPLCNSTVRASLVRANVVFSHLLSDACF
jgi:hypothetical protein